MKEKQDLQINMVNQNIQNISKIFNYRHDFISEDIDLLKNKYKSISFNNIPESWVIILDDFLQKHGEKISCIQQCFGFLSVIYRNDISNDVIKDQKHVEKRLEKIDLDLFLNLKEIKYDMEN